jgi:hypothetical protein
MSQLSPSIIILVDIKICFVYLIQNKNSLENVFKKLLLTSDILGHEKRNPD